MFAAGDLPHRRRPAGARKKRNEDAAAIFERAVRQMPDRVFCDPQSDNNTIGEKVRPKPHEFQARRHETAGSAPGSSSGRDMHRNYAKSPACREIDDDELPFAVRHRDMQHQAVRAGRERLDPSPRR